MIFTLGHLEKHYPYKLIKILTLVISFPILILKIVEPLNIVASNILFYLVTSTLIPSLLYYFLETFLSYQSRLFILIISSILISLVFNRTLLRLIYTFSADGIKHEDSKRIKLAKMRLTYYTLRKTSITFYIYLAYFIYIFIYSLYFLNNKSIFLSKEVDNAVMQAFFVFIAFDNLKLNVKTSYIRPSLVLTNINKLVFSHKSL